MPPRKRAGQGGASSGSARRSARRGGSRKNEDDIPDIYKDMLKEAYDANPDDFEISPRPAKRQRTTEPQNGELGSSRAPPTPAKVPLSRKALQAQAEARAASQIKPELKVEPVQEKIIAPPARRSTHVSVVPPPRLQTITSNNFDDSDVVDEFEDVIIDQHADSSGSEDMPAPEPRDINLDLSAPLPSNTRSKPKRRPLTKAERLNRLEIHKAHLLCLLAHQAYRNKWCDDEQVQRTLKKLVSKKLINKLHSEGTSGVRAWNFDQALREICDIWRRFWSSTIVGQGRATWHDIDLEKEMEDAQDPIDLDDFRDAAKTGRGSRDLGAQLFCALLRSLALDVRLVCSLQVLPLSAESVKNKREVDLIMAGEQNFGTTRRSTTQDFDESPFPTWWVEVFSSIDQTWQPIDPVVKNVIGRASSFQPPASDMSNSMAYVLAFEDDGTAKDITRRYAKQFNARTRKLRIDSTKSGQKWWDGVMQHFERVLPEDRDQIEDAALDRKLGTEGMPKNVQDFKGHPVYVLERHLRQNEVIEPKRECGKIKVGKSSNSAMESVYRAQDVHACRSADGWYRKGRDVLPGEQPLKRVAARRRPASDEIDDISGDESEGVALYAEFQTQLYIPPPVADGRVPRNGYGNLDVYVSTMIPAGGIHLQHSMAAQAAKLLGIDAAEAVTGFKFKGRQGTAIINGVVIAQEYTAAMLTTISALEQQQDEEVRLERTRIMLGVWKRMMQVLKVRQKVQQDYGDKTEDADDDPTFEDSDDDAGGGFFAGEGVIEATKDSMAEERAVLAGLKDRAPVVLPQLVEYQHVKVTRSPHALPNAHIDQQQRVEKEPILREVGVPPNPDKDVEGGFVAEVEDLGGGFMPEEKSPAEAAADVAGGFLVDGDTTDGGGGGFMPEIDAPMADDDPSPRATEVFAHVTAATVTLNTDEDVTTIANTTKATSPQQSAQRPTRSEDDDGSILSEDPDDADADPQWLDDAFDSS